MYGWRARIGIIVPHVNTTAEAEFWRLAPQGVSIHAARVLSHGMTVEGLIAMAEGTERAARELADLNAAVICYACTSGSFVKGVGHDTEIIERIQRASGTPGVSTSFAVLQALRSFGVKKVAVATPYPDEISQRAVPFLEGNGFQVTRVRGLGLGALEPAYPYSKKPITHTGVPDPSAAYCLARDVMSPEAEAVLISCTNFRAIDVLDLLEQELGVPVISANQATFWLALRTAGLRDRIVGYGSLLQRQA